jgi:hypothetical protein
VACDPVGHDERPGHGILLLHLGLALVALAVVGCVRWWVRRGSNRDAPARSLELAYLNGGHRLVVYTALAALRRGADRCARTAPRTFISADWWHRREPSDQASSVRVKGDPEV